MKKYIRLDRTNNLFALGFAASDPNNPEKHIAIVIGFLVIKIILWKNNSNATLN